MSPEQKTMQDKFIEAGVWEEAHIVLNSGLHTDVKIEMDYLAQPPNYDTLDDTIREVCVIGQANDIQGYMPVPEGAYNIAVTGPVLPNIFEVTKVGKREFLLPETTKRAIKNFDQLAIFEDVVTTGGTPATLAHKVKSINPDIEIDLIALWRRGELDERYTSVFRTCHFLVEKIIPAWPAKDCLNPDCQTT